MWISAVAWVPVHGIWARHTAPGVGGIEPHPGGSRWLAPGTPGVYLADEEETAWAELYRRWPSPGGDRRARCRAICTG